MLFAAIAVLAGPVITIAQTTVAIAPAKMNVLYIGVDDPVSIAVAGGVDGKVQVSISGGSTMNKIGAGLYNAGLQR